MMPISPAPRESNAGVPGSGRIESLYRSNVFVVPVSKKGEFLTARSTSTSSAMVKSASPAPTMLNASSWLCVTMMFRFTFANTGEFM